MSTSYSTPPTRSESGETVALVAVPRAKFDLHRAVRAHRELDDCVAHAGREPNCLVFTTHLSTYTRNEVGLWPVLKRAFFDKLASEPSAAVVFWDSEQVCWSSSAGQVETFGAWNTGFYMYREQLPGARVKRTAIYLAAPLTAPTRAGIEENRANAARWAAFLVEHFPVAVECSWVVLTGQLEETPENRKRGLECDVALVELCAEVWMVGGRVSSGMRFESDHARSLGIKVIDLTDMGPAVQDTPAWLESLRFSLEGQGSGVCVATEGAK